MEKFLFLDLDDTIFQTARKCASLEHAEPASYNLQGEPSSYFLPKQKALLSSLAREWRIIPTTARTRAAYARVDLAELCQDGAILNHGGTVVMQNGLDDATWQAKMVTDLKPQYLAITTIKQSIEQYAQLYNMTVLVRITTESECTYYVEVRHHQADYAALQQLLQVFITPLLEQYPDFIAYLNSNSLTILPRCVNKSHAVAYKIASLKQQYGEIITMGMGDSASDMPFMALCDYVMSPKNTQLHGLLQ